MPSFIEMYRKPVSAFLELSEGQVTADSSNNDTGTEIESPMEINTATKTKPGGKHIDIQYLILNCVRPALALVKDPEQDSQRTTERIRIVLNLIQQFSDKGKIIVINLSKMPLLLADSFALALHSSNFPGIFSVKTVLPIKFWSLACRRL